MTEAHHCTCSRFTCKFYIGQSCVKRCRIWCINPLAIKRRASHKIRLKWLVRIHDSLFTIIDQRIKTEMLLGIIDRVMFLKVYLYNFVWCLISWLQVNLIKTREAGDLCYIYDYSCVSHNVSEKCFSWHFKTMLKNSAKKQSKHINVIPLCYFPQSTLFQKYKQCSSAFHRACQTCTQFESLHDVQLCDSRLLKICFVSFVSLFYSLLTRWR